MGVLLGVALLPAATGAAPGQTPGSAPAPTSRVAGPAQTAQLPTLAATDSAGRAISLQALRGQVVLVLVWSTDCPVCLSKMPEIRANHAGWVAQGFQVLTINTDARPDQLRSWEAARRATVPLAQQWPSLWAHSRGFSTSLALTDAVSSSSGSANASVGASAAHLPLIYVMDRQGALRFQSSGRMPAEVWDTIAELL